jgi:hypothetical protein
MLEVAPARRAQVTGEVLKAAQQMVKIPVKFL